MRLINTSTLQCSSFIDSQIPPYAILSHRWREDGDEVSYEDIKSLQTVSSKKRFSKLTGFCDKARSEYYVFAWIDTCCINKSDLTELSEAINSMYRWYSNAGLCIVYLEDELIAPAQLSFYDKEWQLLGTRLELTASLSNITNIPVNVLDGSIPPKKCSVAQRMSWAAGRDTTRLEDQVYSLLGLFGVNMPLIYGERQNAFIRLQEEIIRTSDDESIFAWSLDEINHPNGYSGLLAPSPSSFLGCHHLFSIPGSLGFSNQNIGLSIRLQTVPYSIDTYYAFLNCTKQDDSLARYAIFVTKLSTEHQYCRVTIESGASTALKEVPKQSVLRDIRVRQDPLEGPASLIYGFWLRTIEPPYYKDCVIQTLSRSESLEPDYIHSAPDQCDVPTGIISLTSKQPSNVGWSRIRWIQLGFDADFNPVWFLANGTYPMGFNQNFFSRVLHGSYETPQRTSLFSTQAAWIKQDQRPPTAKYGWPSNVCVVKGDRRTGLSTTLDGLNIQLDIRLLPYVSARNTTDGAKSIAGSKIWTVDISDHGGPYPETIRSDCILQRRWLFTLGAAFSPAVIGVICCAKADRMKAEEKAANGVPYERRFVVPYEQRFEDCC